MNKSLKDIVLACSLVAAVAGGMALAMPASASSTAATTVAQAAQATQAAHERPIHDAARLGRLQDVSRLLQSDPSQRDARTLQGATPLHHAAMNADPGPLKALAGRRRQPQCA
jgi:ankyrin repeat protein